MIGLLTLTLTVLDVLPMFIVVAFVGPMLRVIALLSTDSNLAVDEFRTDAFVVPRILVATAADPRVNDPEDKLEPIVMAELENVGSIVINFKVPDIVVNPFIVFIDGPPPILTPPVAKPLPMFIKANGVVP